MTAREGVLCLLLATIAAVAATLVPWLRVGPGALLHPHELAALVLSGRLSNVPRGFGLLLLTPAASLAPAYLAVLGPRPRQLFGVAIVALVPAVLLVVIVSTRGGAAMELGWGSVAVLVLAATYGYCLFRLFRVRVDSGANRQELLCTDT